MTGAIIGGVKGGKEGAKRGSELDLQFAELKRIDGLDVTRPTPDRIDVYVNTVPSHETLAAIAAVFSGREQRSIDIEAADPVPLDLRDAFIDLGVPESSISVQRNDDLQGAIIRIRYLYRLVFIDWSFRQARRCWKARRCHRKGTAYVLAVVVNSSRATIFKSCHKLTNY